MSQVETEAHPERFSEVLEKVHQLAISADDAGLSFDRLIETAGPKAPVFLSVFLVLPFLQPIPLPGISTILGLVIALFGLFMALDRTPHLPFGLGERKVSRETLLRICTSLERASEKLEKFVRPRGEFLLGKRWFRLLNGLVLCIHGLLLSLPLPIPLSNFLPALVLFLVALGTLEEDAFVIALGYSAAVVCSAFFVALVAVPYLGYRLLGS